MTKSRRVALIAVISVVMFGCARSGDQAPVVTAQATPKPVAQKPKLTFTINSWIGWAPLYLAKEKGLLGELDLTITRVEDTGARKSTMIAEQVDGYASSVDNFALDSAQGVPGKIVLAFDESFGGDGIVTKRSIASVPDLKGKKVAFQKGLPSHFLLLKVLKENGMSASDVEQVDMDADKAGAAFTSGKLDAAVTWEPWISKAAEMADGKILVTTRDYPGLIVDTMVFRSEVLEAKRPAVEMLIRGWFRALEYWKANKAESDAIMAKEYSLDVNDFAAMCEGVRFYDLERNKEYFGQSQDGPMHEVFSAASDLWQEAGVISSKTLAKEKIDPSFVRSLR